MSGEVVFTRGSQNCLAGRAPAPLTWDYVIRPSRKLPWELDIALSTCGNGHTCRMVSNVHTVAADGTITPSYQCPCCSFHVMAKFEGWDPNHVYEYDEEAP